MTQNAEQAEKTNAALKAHSEYNASLAKKAAEEVAAAKAVPAGR